MDLVALLATELALSTQTTEILLLAVISSQIVKKRGITSTSCRLVDIKARE